MSRFTLVQHKVIIVSTECQVKNVNVNEELEIDMEMHALALLHTIQNRLVNSSKLSMVVRTLLIRQIKTIINL